MFAWTIIVSKNYKMQRFEIDEKKTTGDFTKPWNFPNRSGTNIVNLIII